MDYEKKYKEALEVIKDNLDALNEITETGANVVNIQAIKNCFYRAFPEIKEPEDNRMRKALIKILNEIVINTNYKELGIDYGIKDIIAWLKNQGEQKTNIPKWKYKKDDMPLLKDSIILNKYGCVVKSPSGAMVSDAWVLDYDELTKLPKEEVEKQGEKPQGKTALETVEEEKVDNANKVKPKFHEGEWIVWQDKCYKVNYNGCGYELVDQNGLSTSLEYGTADENAHLWDTIKYAEDGDVLVSDNIVFIFNKIHDIWIKCHCSLFDDNSFCEVDFDLMHIKYGKEVFPATKEQCDKLFKAMADAGYTFDFEKKELNKIEFNPDDLIEASYQQQADDLIDMVTEKPADKVEPKFKVKYAGSEYNVLEIKESAGVIYYGIEDEPNHIDYVLSDDCEIISGYGEKEKGSPYPTKSAIFSGQNSAWSEDDEVKINRIISFLKNLNVSDNDILLKDVDWLKYLKDKLQPQKKWKPTEEQMKALEHFVRSIGESGYASPYDNDTKLIYSLLEQLKQL